MTILKKMLYKDKDNFYAVKNNPITQSSTNVISNSCSSLYLTAGEVFVLQLAMALDPPERKTA
jgi:hypothetical protein